MTKTNEAGGLAMRRKTKIAAAIAALGAAGTP